MTYAIGLSDDIAPFDTGRLSRRASTPKICAAAMLALCGLGGAWLLDHAQNLAPSSPGIGRVADRPRAEPPGPVAAEPDASAPPSLIVTEGPTAETPATAASSVMIVRDYSALLDPAYSLGPAPGPLAEGVPPETELALSTVATGARQGATAAPRASEIAEAGPMPADRAPAVADAAAPVPPPSVSPVAAVVPLPEPPLEPALVLPQVAADVPLPPPLPPAALVPPPVAADIPLPAPRPPEMRFAESQGRAPQRSMVSGRGPMVSSAQPDNRNFFEKLFGMPAQPPRGPMLAYAAPEDGIVRGGPALGSAAPTPPYDRWTAVYDISAHTVYMPDGSRLEAHSGLGNRLDDPRYISERMRGPTPPHVYELTPREQLFHGVEALRLNPVGGGGVFGRTGLLAHTYMLGPNGDSNGCVSFRNYRAFLEAFKNGQVRRLAVVARSI